MFFIFANRGIFEISGCKVYIEPAGDFYNMMLTIFSEGRTEIIAEFSGQERANDALLHVRSVIRKNERKHVDISGYELSDPEEIG